MKTYYAPDVRNMWPEYTVIIQLAESPEDASRKINDRIRLTDSTTLVNVKPQHMQEVTDFLHVIRENGGKGSHHVTRI